MLTDWTDGYVAEVNYTYGYYAELNPLRLAVPFLNVGLQPPDIASACELGFGQGVSVNIHAAASPVAWHGTDFNPAHAAFAQSLAAAAGSGAELVDQSFAQFAARSDLPDFDFIALHGIWSWISEENQRVIIDFIGRKLKVGGAIYISYNTQPGFAAMVPLRHLLLQQAETAAGPGRGILAQIDAALAFVDRLLAVNPGFAAANPTIGPRFDAIKKQNRNYLAHEYFNRDWRATQFGDIAEWLAPAKLSYAGSANYLDHIDAVNLTPEQQQFLAETGDPVLRQTVRDFIVNQQFRRDYWVKGAQRLSPLETAERIRQLRVVLVNAPGEVALTVAGALGQRDMAAAVYRPILDLLGDGNPTSIGQLEQALGDSVRFGSLFEAVMVLAGKGDLAPAQDEEAQARVRARAEGLNRRILDKARGSGELAHLASPVTGGGIATPRFDQLFLLGRRQGRQSADELAEFAWDTIAPQGQRVIRDNQPLERPEDNLAELAAQAHEFLDKRLALYHRLQVA